MFKIFYADLKQMEDSVFFISYVQVVSVELANLTLSYFIQNGIVVIIKFPEQRSITLITYIRVVENHRSCRQGR